MNLIRLEDMNLVRFEFGVVISIRFWYGFGTVLIRFCYDFDTVLIRFCNFGYGSDGLASKKGSRNSAGTCVLWIWFLRVFVVLIRLLYAFISFWYSFDTFLIRLWYDFDTILIRFWCNLIRVWYVFWYNFETILIGFWYDFDTVLDMVPMGWLMLASKH